MLAKRTFVTLPGATSDETVIIPAARVAEHQRSRSLWDDANTRAATLLQQAREQAQQETRQTLAQAEADFWQQADSLLQGVAHERENLEQVLVAQAGRLLRDALSRILAEVPAQERHTALLKQLLKQQQNDAKGTLYCHPGQLAEVDRWLKAHPHLEWRLASDETLEEDAMKLITPHGVMSLNWQRAIAQLLPPETPDSHEALNQK
ncbi:type III secretion protein L|uniref:Type III secretion protein L n=1 Tax=Brenneria salicis ATCC 15712 = DSM 30166 TaxID=714314 RepID=A0A366I8R0_9GAMM|nr:type III secretion system stator protein SctL [Brenneria salicis]NMN91773.1 type III secretion protein L [Brenneria salicis ATCC 15712 = DSM 30166]RBP65840.1 type III secretion protein L [Brenneria salicis ATCC 15712 = DSM 30166]RLM31874.1 type III secretion protein [Brenneria salicis ATCC 15712 = DSM 30166]